MFFFHNKSALALALALALASASAVAKDSWAPALCVVRLPDWGFAFLCVLFFRESSKAKKHSNGKCKVFPEATQDPAISGPTCLPEFFSFVSSMSNCKIHITHLNMYYI